MQQDHHDQQRSEARMRALLAVFDMPAPPDFQAQVLARAGARQRLQRQRYGWMRRALQRRRLKAPREALRLWPGLWRPVGVGAVLWLLIVGGGLSLWSSSRETHVALPQVSLLVPREVSQSHDPSGSYAEQVPVSGGEPSASSHAQAGPQEERMLESDTAPRLMDAPESSKAPLLTAFVPVEPVKPLQRRRGLRGQYRRPQGCKGRSPGCKWSGYHSSRPDVLPMMIV